MQKNREVDCLLFNIIKSTYVYSAMEQQFCNSDDSDTHESENEDNVEENWGAEFIEETNESQNGNFPSTEHSCEDDQQERPTSNLNLSKESDRKVISRMELNDHKAGMQGLDRERINQIIFEASKGSLFYESEQRKEKQVAEKIALQSERLRNLTSQQRRDALTETDRIVQELEESRDLSRSIVHIDMDAFYAAVEMRDNPKLRNIPVAVGSNAMLSTSNYAARKYGVRAAMPGFIAKKLCPHLTIVPLHFDKYCEVSRQVKEIFSDYDPNFVAMSLDEAYLDLTDYLEQRQQNGETRKLKVTCTQQAPATTLDVKGDASKHNSTKIKSVSSDTGLIENTRVVCSSVSGERKLETAKNYTDSDLVSCTTDVSGVHFPDDTAGVCGAVSDDTKLQATEDSTSDFPSCATNASRETDTWLEFGCDVEDVVRELRFRIEQRTQLTASAGIAPNTMLAKICSDKNKPNGQYYLKSNYDTVMHFVRNLPVRKVSGIGKVSEQMLKALGITTCKDLYSKRDLLYLLHSQISFRSLIQVSLGLGATRLENDRERQSMSTETTFSEINQPLQLYSKCRELCHSLAEDLQEASLASKTVTIKLKTVNFETKTRAASLPTSICLADEIFAKAKELLGNEIRACLPKPLRLRLMGIRLSNLCSATEASKGSKQETITEIMKRNLSRGGDDSVTAVKLQGNASSEKLQPHSDTEVENSFICPVCGSQQTISVESSTVQINKHLDLCLTENAKRQTCQSMESNSADTLEHFVKKSSENNFAACTALNNAGELICSEERYESNAGLDVKQDQKESCGSSSKVQGMICPVCDTVQNLTGEDCLEEFNRHVDLCLNKATVKQLVSSKEDPHQSYSQQSTSQGKRKRKSLQSTSKKLTLDQFWSK